MACASANRQCAIFFARHRGDDLQVVAQVGQIFFRSVVVVPGEKTKAGNRKSGNAEQNLADLRNDLQIITTVAREKNCALPAR